SCQCFLRSPDLLPRITAFPTPTLFRSGLATGRDPDPFLVGGAVLGLLTEVAEGGPLVGLVDDVQWLDRPSAQVLGFVARRLPAADRKSTRLNSSHVKISYAVFCLKKKN